jgi:hypothetical protein
VEVSIALNVKLHDKILTSTHLGFGCDETPHLKAGRNFIEVHVFGCDANGGYFCEFLHSIELFGEQSKTAQATVDYLVQSYSYLKNLCMSWFALIRIYF